MEGQRSLCFQCKINESLMGLEQHDGRYSFFQVFFLFSVNSCLSKPVCSVFSKEHKMVYDHYSLNIFP